MSIKLIDNRKDTLKELYDLSVGDTFLFESQQIVYMVTSERQGSLLKKCVALCGEEAGKLFSLTADAKIERVQIDIHMNYA